MRTFLPTAISVTFLLLFTLTTYATPTKYGKEAKPLAQDHAYFLKNPAPDYWALAPYYVHQQTGSACSIASAAMIVNGANHFKVLDSETPLATQNSVLHQVGDSNWTAAVGGMSLKTLFSAFKYYAYKLIGKTEFSGLGVTLDELGPRVEKALRLQGFPKAEVQVFHAELSEAGSQTLHQALVENEKSAQDFIILNFLQGVYTGDSEVGHVSPLGAYDAKLKRALVMDVDREWYEPYWVSEETLLRGMATKDSSSGKNRGWLWVHLNY
jgi:hypothetical protein